MHRPESPLHRQNGSSVWFALPAFTLVMAMVLVNGGSVGPVADRTATIAPSSVSNLPNCILANTTWDAEGGSLAYDPTDQSVYSLSFLEAGYKLYVVDNTSGAPEDGVFAGGPNLNSLGVDPENGQIIVSDSGNNIYPATTQIYSSQEKEVANLPFYSSASIFDPTTGDLVLLTPASYPSPTFQLGWSENLTWVDGANDTVARSIDLGVVNWNPGYPPTNAGPLAYDPQSGLAFVGFHNNLTVVNGSSGVIVESLALSYAPTSLAFDPKTGDIYVAGWVEQPGTYYDETPAPNVTIVNGTTAKVVGQISGLTFNPVYGPALAEDPVVGWLFIDLNDSVAEVNTTTDEFVGSFVPPHDSVPSLVLDPSNGRLYVEAWWGVGDPTTTTDLVVTPGVSCPPPNSLFIGLPGYDGYILIGVVVAVVAAVVTLVILRKRKEKGKPDPIPPPPAGPPALP